MMREEWVWGEIFETRYRSWISSGYSSQYFGVQADDPHVHRYPHRTAATAPGGVRTALCGPRRGRANTLSSFVFRESRIGHDRILS